jgi:hypothetical protein
MQGHRHKSRFDGLVRWSRPACPRERDTRRDHGDAEVEGRAVQRAEGRREADGAVCRRDDRPRRRCDARASVSSASSSRRESTSVRSAASRKTLSCAFRWVTANICYCGGDNRNSVIAFLSTRDPFRTTISPKVVPQPKNSAAVMLRLVPVSAPGS